MKEKRRGVLSKIRILYRPLRPVYTKIINWYGNRNKKWLITKVYKNTLHRDIDWENPRDLNEKINWLKLHSDPYEWAKLADKYSVRDYVKSKGLENILVPLYGHWESAQDVVDSWDELPDEFVLKCNNGNGKVRIICTANGGKGSVNLDELKAELTNWISSKYGGISGTEPHYSLIKNSIIAEKYLHDESEDAFSDSIVDYKIWCFSGKPYGCYVCFNRNLVTKEKDVMFYDLDWNMHPEVFSGEITHQTIDKPQEWGKMLEIATILCQGQPEVRVDLYYSSGKIYFGEMTMTGKGGFMNYYTEKALLEMGEQIKLDLSTPGNMFA